MAKPPMQRVSSSNLAAVGYDQDDMTLYIRFKSSGTYSYDNVPKPVYENLMSAGSKGKFFYRNIRDSYPYEKL